MLPIIAPPRITENQHLDAWLRDVYRLMGALPEDIVWSRVGTTISPIITGDDLALGTGDISCTAITAAGAIAGASLTDGVASIVAGVITGASMTASSITAGNLNIGSGQIFTTGNINGGNLALGTGDILSCNNILASGDLSCVDVSCNGITCDDVDASDIVCTSLTI